MSVKKTYSLSSTQQLIDLNGETTNFDLSFSVTSKGKQPFDLLVVDQSTLDNNPNLEFKRANEGSMSGNIISDKNIYQNYFLCLKSETPCDVDVTIDKKEISPSLQESNQIMNGLYTPQVPQIQHPPLPYDQPLTKIPTHVQHQCQVSSGTNWKMIFITIILVCGGLYLYYLYTNKNKDKSKKVNSVQESVIQPTIIQQISNTPVAPVVPSVPIVIPSIPTVSEVPIVVPSAPTVPSVSNFGFTKRELDVQNMIARLNSLPTK